MTNVRRRLDVWGISVGTTDAARSKPWHPVLDAYGRGVGAMMARDAKITVDSWLWAANTHGVPRDMPSNQRKPLWNKCEHASRFFLPWHRAYLVWFETTIQSLVQDQTWALPYWDYSDPTRSVLGIPPEFAVEQRTVNDKLVPNSLFLDETLRPGQPLAEDVDIVTALSQRFFLTSPPLAGLVGGFGGVDGASREFGRLESLPHNPVHTDIGGDTGYMRDPTVSARDPIFWLHHANIDRLWEVWRNLPGSVDLLDQGGVSRQAVSEWRSAKFRFGGNGATIEYSIDDVKDTTNAKMNYEYETITLPPSIAAQVNAQRPSADEGIMPREEITPTPPTRAVGPGCGHPGANSCRRSRRGPQPVIRRRTAWAGTSRRRRVTRGADRRAQRCAGPGALPQQLRGGGRGRQRPAAAKRGRLQHVRPERDTGR